VTKIAQDVVIDITTLVPAFALSTNMRKEYRYHVTIITSKINDEW